MARDTRHDVQGQGFGQIEVLVKNRRIAGLAVAALLAVASVEQAAVAATPSSGKITKSKRTLSWNGGPFTLSSPIPGDTGIDCLQGESDPICDHFMLTVTLGDRAQLEVKVTTANPCTVDCLAQPAQGDDYDIHVYAPDGRKVAESATPAGIEKLIFTHRARYNGRPYEIRIVPWGVAPGSSYKGTVRARTIGR